jgi:hypothetical protein
MNRTAPMTDFARNQIWSLYDARDELVGGQGINAVTRPGTYGYDDVNDANPHLAGDCGSRDSVNNFSSDGWSGGSSDNWEAVLTSVKQLYNYG